mmetsp:Transcript_18636/g.31054  ORF Transcript_18636/g.31054 Transcript_18636/m.31054 type:complete len:296 (-) Transcript_18636:67-954(-)
MRQPARRGRRRRDLGHEADGQLNGVQARQTAAPIVHQEVHVLRVARGGSVATAPTIAAHAVAALSPLAAFSLRLGNRQLHGRRVVELDRHLPALVQQRTHDLRLQEPAHHVLHGAIVAQEVLVPVLAPHSLLVSQRLHLARLSVRFLLNDIHVFMKSIQHKGEQVVGVLLLEGGVVAVHEPKHSPKRGGLKERGWVGSKPEILQQRSKFFGKHSFGGVHTGGVNVLLVLVRNEVLDQREYVRQALQRAVQITGVSQVGQARQPPRHLTSPKLRHRRPAPSLGRGQALQAGEQASL